MWNHKILSSALVIAGATFAAGAIAGPETSSASDPAMKHSTMPSASFDQLDTNKNGYISETEAKASPTLAMKTKELDKNGDGQLDRTEFSAFESASSMTSPTTGKPTDKQGKSNY